MNVAMLVLRLVVGLLFIGHGTQKLFGWFGGHGRAGTAQFFDSLGLRPGRRHALAAGLTEALGGLLLALGLVTPLAAAAITAVMVTAIATVHGAKGPWSTNGGYEYNLVLMACVFALSGVGAGAWSLDHALSLNLAGGDWAFAQLAAGILGGLGAVFAGRFEPRRRTAQRGRRITTA
jgi:putative oxidoreductase